MDLYMAAKGLNDNQVTVSAGLSVGLINNARKGGFDLGKKSVEKILSAYQDLNRVWLITGSGKMFNTPISVLKPETSKHQEERKLENQDIPLYEITATAGITEIFSDTPADPEDLLRVPNLPPVDGAVYVRGDSMSPLLKSGDIVIYKKISPAPDAILWGQIYLLSYTIAGDAFTVVKYIKRSPIEGHIRLVSANDFYEPVDIPASSVTAIALVKASVTFHCLE